MKSLADSDEYLDDWHRRPPFAGKARLNRIACPHCGVELYDVTPEETITTAPGRKYVMCNACGWHGTRIADD